MAQSANAPPENREPAEGEFLTTLGGGAAPSSLPPSSWYQRNWSLVLIARELNTVVKGKDMISPALEPADSSGTKYASVNGVVAKQTLTPR